MYCFGSTIACTQLPIFAYNGRQKILPKTYNSYKPGTNGYNMIRSKWMQDFLKYIEEHVIHYLSRRSKTDKKAKLTLFLVTLAKQIIP